MSIERDQFKTLIILVALGLVFVLAMWMPMRSKQQGLRARLEAANAKAEANADKTQDLSRLTREVEDLQRHRAQYTRRVPQRNESGELLRTLSNRLRIHDAVDQEIQTRPAVEHGSFVEVPVTLRFKASFPQVHAVLREIESLSRLVCVSRVQLEPVTESRRRTGTDDPAPDAEPTRLSVNLELKTFHTAQEGQAP